MPDNIIVTPGVATPPISSDDVGGIHFQRVKLDLGGDGVSSPVVGGLPIVSIVTSSQIIATSLAAVAAGGQATLDSNQISSGKTGKLLEVVVAASVPFKVLLQTVVNGIATTRIPWFTQVGGWDWTAPAKNFITVTESPTAGFDGFRVVVTNLDPTEPADLYAAFLYDEEP